MSAPLDAFSLESAKLAVSFAKSRKEGLGECSLGQKIDSSKSKIFDASI